MFGTDIFQRFFTILHLRETSYQQFFALFCTIFAAMSAKPNVSSQSTFYAAQKKHLKIRPTSC